MGGKKLGFLRGFKVKRWILETDGPLQVTDSLSDSPPSFPWFYTIPTLYECIAYLPATGYHLYVLIYFVYYSVNVFLSMLAKLESKLEMLVGSCTVLSMEFNLMDKCLRIRRSELVMIPSTPFSARLGLENMSPVLSLSI